MKLTIKSKTILITLLLFNMITNVTILSGISRYVFLGFIFVILILHIINKNILYIDKNFIRIIIFPELIFLFINVLLSDVEYKSMYFFLILINSMSVLFINWNIKDIKQIFTWLNRIIIFCSITVLINLVIPSLFSKYLSFLIIPSSIETISIEVSNGQYSGIIGERSLTCVLIIIGIALNFAEALIEKKKWKNNFTYILYYLFIILLTGKRALLVIPLVVSLLLLFTLKFKGKMKKILTMIPLMIVTGVILFDFIPAAQVVLERNMKLISNNMFLNGRELLWMLAIQMYYMHPWIGCGLNTFNTKFSEWGIWSSSWGSHAHNTYIQLLGETGKIGLYMFVIFFVIALFKTIRLSRNKKVNTNKELYFITIFSLFIQIFWLLYGFTGNPFYTPGQCLMYYFSVSLSLYVERSAKNKVV
ncbi:TPA: O-antigen ligase family protein [Clostridium perfringens]|nr:O-antigen ligase family protein [Clostridium perfringens]